MANNWVVRVEFDGITLVPKRDLNKVQALQLAQDESEELGLTHVRVDEQACVVWVYA